jgi:hypothetical protein
LPDGDSFWIVLLPCTQSYLHNLTFLAWPPLGPPGSLQALFLPAATLLSCSYSCPTWCPLLSSPPINHAIQLRLGARPSFQVRDTEMTKVVSAIIELALLYTLALL